MPSKFVNLFYGPTIGLDTGLKVNRQTGIFSFAIHIGVQADFVWGGESSLPEKYFDSARKNARLTCKIALPNSPHRILVKIPDFGHLISLDGMNSVFFRLIDTNFFFHFWPLASARKI